MKSVPFARTGSPTDFARAYEKQSPKLSAAGCRPFPYLRQAERARSTCSESTGTIWRLARTTKRSNSRPAASPCRLSRTIPVSSTLAAEISRVPAAVMAARNVSRSGSAKKMAASAEVSITMRLRSTGESVLVVAQDFVGAAGVQNRQLVYAPKYFLQLAGEYLASTFAPDPIQALLQGLLDRPSQGFSSLRGDLPRQALHLDALDTKSHS